MRRILSIGLAVGVLGLAFAGAARAQDPGAQDAAVKSGPPSIDWTIGDLLTNPAAKAVLAKDLPALLGSDQLEQAKNMSLRQISQFPQAHIDAAMLSQIQADLTASADAPPTATPPPSSAPPPAM